MYEVHHERGGTGSQMIPEMKNETIKKIADSKETLGHAQTIESHRKLFKKQ